jgi:hypothetical protein
MKRILVRAIPTRFAHDVASAIEEEAAPKAAEISVRAACPRPFDHELITRLARRPPPRGLRGAPARREFRTRLAVLRLEDFAELLRAANSEPRAVQNRTP